MKISIREGLKAGAVARSSCAFTYDLPEALVDMVVGTGLWLLRMPMLRINAGSVPDQGTLTVRLVAC